MVTTFRSTFDERRLLVTDIRGTMTGGDLAGLGKLNAELQSVRESAVLAYSSGRSLPRIMEEIEGQHVIAPDYVLSSVGTEIHRLPGEHPLDEWYRYIQIGFEREAILAFIAQRFPNLELQPEEGQTPLKISYLFENAAAEQLEALRRALIEEGFPAQVIYSSDLFLDVIPDRAGTGAAVKFLIDSLVLTPSQVYVCGDSGNDIDLFQYGFRGIVVANASHELKRAVQLRAYFSHRAYAEGLLEGLRHYNFFTPRKTAAKPDFAREALERAVESLRRNVTPMGFTAASTVDNPMTTDDSNYFAVWSRDGVKTGLWTLCLNDPDLTECFRRTLELLAHHQSDTGQVPANVRLANEQPDYSGIGGIASIDSVLWFVIGACRYAATVRDAQFLRRMFPHVRLAMQWLHAHDSNNCSLLEIPESSDWMDLFPRSYNVLYDEVLWYLACRDFNVACAALGEDDLGYGKLSGVIRRNILRKFWPTAEKLQETQESFSETQFTIGEAQYLLAQISPFGFSWRCDVYANLLAGLMGLLDERKMDRLFYFLWGVGVNSPYPIKCFYPPILSGASDWKDYFITNFLNLPDHYHNGGIWPFIGGLWVRFLAQIGHTELAHQELNMLAEACKLGIYSEWEFNEWLHGHTGRPMGKAHQAWSAASYVMAYKALRDDSVPADFEPLTVERFGVEEEERNA
jgi:sucrose-6F-phosphate phosphohydrolase